MYAKALVIVAVVALVASVQAVDARPKRSVLVASPVVAGVPVASVPVVQSATVVQHNPTSVVKTEQVRSGDHASYTYTHEVKTQPAVVHQTHAAVVAAAAPATVVGHTVAAAAVPAYQYAAYYPSYTHSYAYSPYSYAYSPYSYVIGK